MVSTLLQTRWMEFSLWQTISMLAPVALMYCASEVYSRLSV